MPTPDPQTGRIAEGSDADFDVAAERTTEKRILPSLPAANKLRAKIRAHTEPWIGEVRFDFPTWSVRSRVFDWMVDEADVPIPDPLPPWEVPERRQMDFYLRPVRVVRR